MAAESNRRHWFLREALQSGLREKGRDAWTTRRRARLSDEDIRTILPGEGRDEVLLHDDTDDTDSSDGTDGGDSDGTDAEDGADTDGTDGKDADGTDGDTTDGTDGDSSATS